MSIEFTQFLRPNGKQRLGWIDRPEDIENKAKEIISKGYKFECEELQTGMVSFTIADPKKEEDVEIEICNNGPAVPEAIDKMIERFHKTIS